MVLLFMNRSDEYDFIKIKIPSFTISHNQSIDSLYRYRSILITMIVYESNIYIFRIKFLEGVVEIKGIRTFECSLSQDRGTFRECKFETRLGWC